MRFLVLAIAVLLSACTEQEAQSMWPTQMATQAPDDITYVKVLGRTWGVYPANEAKTVYGAKRDNLDLNPFGAPSARRSPQAARAIELATGCGVERSKMVQDTTARFFGTVHCP